MATEKKYALYLVKDGEGSPKLFHADDVEAAKANGWSEPDFPKSNGEPWNAEAELAGQTLAAEIAKEGKAEAAKKDKAAEKADSKKK